MSFLTKRAMWPDFGQETTASRWADTWVYRGMVLLSLHLYVLPVTYVMWISSPRVEKRAAFLLNNAERCPFTGTFPASWSNPQPLIPLGRDFEVLNIALHVYCLLSERERRDCPITIRHACALSIAPFAIALVTCTTNFEQLFWWWQTFTLVLLIRPSRT